MVNHQSKIIGKYKKTRKKKGGSFESSSIRFEPVRPAPTLGEASPGNSMLRKSF
jgi:hypothetical protein